MKHDWEAITDNKPDNATHECSKCALRVEDPTKAPEECSGMPGVYDTATTKVNWPGVRMQNTIKVQRKFLERCLSELNWIGLHKSFHEDGDGFEGWCAGPALLINDLFNYLHGKEEDDARGTEGA
jgi:hypothetical protein